MQEVGAVFWGRVENGAPKPLGAKVKLRHPEVRLHPLSLGLECKSVTKQDYFPSLVSLIHLQLCGDP